VTLLEYADSRLQRVVWLRNRRAAAVNVCVVALLQVHAKMIGAHSRMQKHDCMGGLQVVTFLG
jgi:hypothetical protein